MPVGLLHASGYFRMKAQRDLGRFLTVVDRPRIAQQLQTGKIGGYGVLLAGEFRAQNTLQLVGAKLSGDAAEAYCVSGETDSRGFQEIWRESGCEGFAAIGVVRDFNFAAIDITVHDDAKMILIIFVLWSLCKLFSGVMEIIPQT